MDGEVKLEDEEAKAEAPPPGEMDRREECTAPLYLLDDDASATEGARRGGAGTWLNGQT